MNRIDRISAILIQLQSKPIVKAKEIAERFNISLRTVYRDIRALEEAGVPIGSEAGIGYFLAEGFHLPPVMFTQKEAASLLLAGKLVEKMADSSINKEFDSAMYKIRSVLNNGGQTFLDNLDNYIDIAKIPSDSNQDFPNNFISDIQDAIAHKKIIQLQYLSQSKNEETLRNIEPVGICYYGFNWHLIGYCLLRNDYRDFRTDRIKQLKDTGRQFTKKKKTSLQEYFNSLTRTEHLDKVVVQFHKSILKQVDNPKYYFGYVEEKEVGEYQEMTFLVSPLNYISKWLLSYGSKVKIVTPIQLNNIMHKLTLDLYKHYTT